MFLQKKGNETHIINLLPIYFVFFQGHMYNFFY